MVKSGTYINSTADTTEVIAMAPNEALGLTLNFTSH